MSRYWYDVIAAVCVHSSDYQTHDVLETLLTILAVHCLLLRLTLPPMYHDQHACNAGCMHRGKDAQWLHHRGQAR